MVGGTAPGIHILAVSRLSCEKKNSVLEKNTIAERPGDTGDGKERSVAIAYHKSIDMQPQHAAVRIHGRPK